MIDKTSFAISIQSFDQASLSRQLIFILGPIRISLIEHIRSSTTSIDPTQDPIPLK